MIRRHVTPAVVSFLALLLCSLAAPTAGRAWWIPAAAALACAGVSCVLLAGRIGPRASILLLGASAGLLLGAASQLRMAGSSDRALLPVSEADVSGYVATVSQDGSLTRQGDTVLRLRLQSASSGRAGISGRARGNLLLFLGGDSRFSIGQRLRVHAGLARAAGIGPEQWISSARRADVTTLGFAGPAWGFRAEARAWLHRAVSRAGYPASSLLEALLVGVREDVPADLYNDFLRTGSLHILALSGLHVTVLYGAAAGLLWFLRRGWQRFLAATVVLLFYQFLAGFMPSLLRATVMIIVGGTAVLLDRDREPINVLALSGIVLLLIDPFQAFTLSFQLSFLALAGILALGTLIQRPLAARLPRFLLLAVAMSAGAQAATLPLVIGAFGAWYPSGLLAALVLVPLTTGFLWAGLAWLPLSLVPWAALHDACAAAFGIFYRVIQFCAETFSRVPGLVFPDAILPWVAAGTGIAVLFAAVVLPLKRGKPA
jgi:competence protein ComEC